MIYEKAFLLANGKPVKVTVEVRGFRIAGSSFLRRTELITATDRLLSRAQSRHDNLTKAK